MERRQCPKDFTPTQLNQSLSLLNIKRCQCLRMQPPDAETKPWRVGAPARGLPPRAVGHRETSVVTGLCTSSKQTNNKVYLKHGNREQGGSGSAWTLRSQPEPSVGTGAGAASLRGIDLANSAGGLEGWTRQHLQIRRGCGYGCLFRDMDVCRSGNGQAVTRLSCKRLFPERLDSSVGRRI